MASSSGLPSKEDVIKKAVEEYEKQLREKEESEKKINEFAQTVVVSMRHKEASKHVRAASHSEVLNVVTPSERIHLQKMYDRYNSDKSVKLILSPNKGSPTGNPMGGFMLITSDDTVIKHASDVVSKAAPFMNIAMMELKAPPELLALSELQIREHIRPKILEFLSQLPDSPPSFGVYCPEEGSKRKDKSDWNTFFPRVNASVGVYRSTDGKLVLIARSHAGERSFKELKPLLTDATAKDILLMRPMVWVREMSKRNTLRLLYSTAKAIGLKPTTAGYDHCARVPKHHKRIKMAIPNLHCITNNFRRDAHQRPVFFVDCTDNNASLDKIPLVVGDYTQGYRTLVQTQKRVTDLSSMLPSFVDMHSVETRPSLSSLHNTYYSGAHVSRCTKTAHKITHHHFVPFDDMEFRRFGQFVGIHKDRPYDRHFEPIISVFH